MCCSFRSCRCHSSCLQFSVSSCQSTSGDERSVLGHPSAYAILCFQYSSTPSGIQRRFPELARTQLLRKRVGTNEGKMEDTGGRPVREDRSLLLKTWENSVNQRKLNARSRYERGRLFVHDRSRSVTQLPLLVQLDTQEQKKNEGHSFRTHNALR